MELRVYILCIRASLAKSLHFTHRGRFFSTPHKFVSPDFFVTFASLVRSRAALPCGLSSSVADERLAP